VRDCCDVAFGHVGLDWRKHVVHDAAQDRPAEVETLLADPSKAKRILGWSPTVDFKGLMTMMVDADLERLKRSA
jgi:GDPmannose 4,6-dehydratase